MPITRSTYDMIHRRRQSVRLLLSKSSKLKSKSGLETSATKSRGKTRTNLGKKRRVQLWDTNLKVGQFVDVKALLSTKVRDYLVSPKDGQRVPVSSLKDKHVLVCCITAPYDLDSISEISVCQALEALYSELSRREIADHVKFVFAVDLAPGSHEAHVHAFFRDLSIDDCLAVPFSDSKSVLHIRDTIRNADLTSRVQALAVDPQGLVLQSGPTFLVKYGAQSFPFTRAHLDRLYEIDDDIRRGLRSTDSPINLPLLLQCDDLPLIGDENKSISTVSLVGKTVGLYLYFTGLYMDAFRGIYEQCLDKGHEFEVILVPLPFDCPDLDSFVKFMKESALKHSSTSSWLTFPFNDKICRTLWRLFCCTGTDNLIIMPHAGCLGDLEGKFFVREFGISAYPFTRDVILEQKVNHFRSQTLASLLGDDFELDVRNKNALLYFAGFNFSYRLLYEMMEQESGKIKKRYPDVVLYFVPLSHLSHYEDEWLSDLGMEILAEEKRKSVIKHVFISDLYRAEYNKETVVAFGKDGKVVSRYAQKRLPLNVFPPGAIFEDTLESEILADLDREMD